jgi:hypothetical protein
VKFFNEESGFQVISASTLAFFHGLKAGGVDAAAAPVARLRPNNEIVREVAGSQAVGKGTGDSPGFIGRDVLRVGR